ncbi:MAG: hypothetical protein KKF98_04065 [Bacteroidetes bacterium]|nr:hypothetical protein [Bacteroidota bacterium]
MFKVSYIKIFIAISFLLFGKENYAQVNTKISDFYEYVNKEWLDNTIISDNMGVVNNWGILWDNIINKSIEILSGDVQYELDKNSEYILAQLQSFYKSADENIPDERKRVYFIQKHYPMIFGAIFSKITIPNDKEEKIKELIRYLTLAFKQKIENSEHVKEKNIDFFLSVLNNIQFKIGAPDISHLPLIPALSSNSFEKNIQLTEDYQLKIKSEKPNWASPPFETDCRYNYNNNTVTIYAGTIFALNSSNNNPAELFATIGRTIAHEMTHAFDRYGNKFNKKDWKRINSSLINQFNQYAIQDIYFINGRKTLQENFADLGGVEVSLLALKLFLKNEYPHCSKEKNLDIICSYFMAYAEFWREKSTPEFEVSTLNGLHAPQKFRAIGPVYNQEDFYRAFEIDAESKYYIDDGMRISIW